MLVPPFNFTALKSGFKSFGLVRDYAGDLPQTGDADLETLGGEEPAASESHQSGHR
jgi:hypothetical protein